MHACFFKVTTATESKKHACEKLDFSYLGECAKLIKNDKERKNRHNIRVDDLIAGFLQELKQYKWKTYELYTFHFCCLFYFSTASQGSSDLG